MTKQLIKQIRDFLKNNYKDKDYFCCLYGSHIINNKTKDDIDVFIALPNYTKEDYKKFKKFIINLHLKNNLEIDKEVPYENKLMVTFQDTEKAIFCCGFEVKNGHFYVPKVEKTQEFLSSQEIRWRLILNALTSPHIFISGNRKIYSSFKQLAENNVILFAIDLLRSKEFTIENLINILLKGKQKECGEEYLGYRNKAPIKLYLDRVIKSGLIFLIQAGIISNQKNGKLILLDSSAIKKIKFLQKKILKRRENKKKIFIGVAWPYVNGEIHIGHLAGYLLPADILARFLRFKNNDVLMVSGSDCFGTPILYESTKKNIEPSILINKYHRDLKKLFKLLDISFDIYTRTNNPIHKKLVQDFFLTLYKKGFIFKSLMKQYYSENEKIFLPDRFVEGICKYCNFDAARGDQCDVCGKILNPGEIIKPKNRLTQTPVILKESEHYFMNWPKLEKFLKEYVKNKSLPWKKWVRNETKKWLELGLLTRAITRDITWGVEVPADKLPFKERIKDYENKSIYVWFDAVIGYLSASIEYSFLEKEKDLWTDFWFNPLATHYYFMGKDNLIFHTLFWPGQLFAYDIFLHLPDFLSINQYLTFGNKKFSKSRGVVITCNDLVGKYGVDEVRFYLCHIMPENQDSSFSYHDFFEKVNNILIGDIGNFINRNLSIAEKHKFQPQSVFKIDQEIINRVRKAYNSIDKNISNCQFRKYLNEIIELARYGNKYAEKKKPWFLKGNEFKITMAELIYLVIAIGILFGPLLPDASKRFQKMLNLSKFHSLKNFHKFHDYIINGIKEMKYQDVKPLFKKIIPENIE